MADTDWQHAKLFKNGRNQCVRLPKEFEVEGTEVRIFRLGRWVLLAPVAPNVGVADIDWVRGAIEELRPLEPELAAMMEQELLNTSEAASGQMPQA